MTLAAPASRNAPCPCGSGRRYKDCHGALAAAVPGATLEALLPAALAAHQAGRLDDAARGYEQALARSPDLFDALHMLGVVRFQQHDYPRARALIARALALRPDIAEARRNLRLVDNVLRRQRAQDDYLRWIDTVERRRELERAPLRERVAAAADAPRLSIVMPTFESPEAALRACLDSVLAQDYPHWELCVADDASRQPHVRAVLSEYAARDPRLRVVHRERNGHISAASNSALELATGEFVALLDHDDALAPGALAEVALAIRDRPGAAIVYSDEDKIDEAGRRFEPYFKPDWNPALLTAQNYVSHLGVYRTALMREVGGFREGLEGAQDWDLLLRCAERVPADAIRHVSQVLYHWRAVQGSTARTMDSKGYAAAAQERAVREAFARRGRDVRIRRVLWDTFLEAVPVQPVGTVSLIVLARDGQAVDAWHAQAQARRATLDVVIAPAATLNGAPRFLGPGTAQAINAAVERASGDIVVVVDADLAPPDAERFDAWCAFAMPHEAGPVGALVLDRHRDIAAGMFVLDDDRIAATPWLGEPEGYWGMAGRTTLVQQVGAVCIDAFAIRRALWRTLGGLDTSALGERYHDIDLGLRAARAGCRPVWFPGVALVHAQSIDDVDVPARAIGADADAMRARWGAWLANDPAYHPDLARPPRLFDLALDP